MKPANSKLRMRIGLIGAVSALVVFYFAGGCPIPLYSVYQSELGMTHAQLSLMSMWYLLGTVIPLLFLSRLSNFIGRKPVTVITICISVTGCCLFAHLTSPETLMLGRFVQGLASGLGSSTVATYVVDLCEGLPKWVGPTITSSAPALGLSTGAFVSGGVYQYTDAGESIVFVIVASVLIAVALLVILGSETAKRHRGALRSIRPTITVGRSLHRMFLASAMIFVGTWAIGGYYQAFSSTIVLETTGSIDSMVSAAVFTASLLPNAIGSFFAKRFDVRSAQRVGMAGFAALTFLALMALKAGMLLPFTLLIMSASFMQGIGFTGSVTGLVSNTRPEDRAGMFATIYLVSYGGAAVPNLVVGLIAGGHTSVEIMGWYCILTAVMFVLMFILTAKRYDEVPIGEFVEV